ncbi:nuclear transport factor 2 family protein [uncultured Kriegella sp.]|uniref:YybH family protein n=1 Tax=uncultured Kriegella sp. TaxID=1798910 RepID=UPI0030D7639F|tara:strand:- start:111539 stop:111970 length:432 start_codon:yes stop_codon:yes gene_type:complete
MKTLSTFLVLLCLASGYAQTSDNNDIAQIQSILDQQERAWSEGDLEGFMQGYWKSDSLTYFSRGKITQGWQTTLDNYKKGYPSKAHTGTLKFKIAKITKINKEAYYVMGEYFLEREVGDANGTFMIVFKYINGEWKIISDSSC